jgi:transcriptional regulator with XRE-family HTH domain
MTLAQGNLLEDFRPTPWPEDFGQRLEGLKVLTGLKWKELAPLLGVSERTMLLWRRGERRPSGANILALTELARVIPGGIDVLCQGDAGALTLWVEGSDTEGDYGE